MNFELYNPAEVGVNPLTVSKLLDMFIAGKLTANAMVMIRHNKVFCEFYRTPYKSGRYHCIASITKSIVSIAAGFAVNKGLININDNVIEYFPDIVKTTANTNLNLMKIEHLLTMTSGQKNDGEFQGLGTGDVIKEFLLSIVPDRPGERFSYNTDGVNVLSQIIERASGVRFDKYVHERLFKPLDIENYIWENETSGIVNAGFGLHLSARDLAKIGVFLLNRGKWNGKQLLSAEWIKQAGSALCDNGKYGYGYLFWRQKPAGSFEANGQGGQHCIILPKEDMVIVFFDAMGNTVDSIWDVLLPGLGNELSDSISGKSLKAKCDSIAIEIPQGHKHNNIAEIVNGKKYALESNSLKITHISLDFDKYELTLYENQKSCTCKIGFDEWIESETYADPNTACTQHVCEIHSPVSIAGAWRDDVFHMKQVYTMMPMIDDMFVSFSTDGNEISIDFKRSDKCFFDPDRIIKGVASPNVIVT